MGAQLKKRRERGCKKARSGRALEDQAGRFGRFCFATGGRVSPKRSCRYIRRKEMSCMRYEGCSALVGPHQTRHINCHRSIDWKSKWRYALHSAASILAAPIPCLWRWDSLLHYGHFLRRLHLQANTAFRKSISRLQTCTTGTEELLSSGPLGNLTGYAFSRFREVPGHTEWNNKPIEAYRLI